MKVDIRDREALCALRPSDVVAYLRSMGWQEDGGKDREARAKYRFRAIVVMEVSRLVMTMIVCLTTVAIAWLLCGAVVIRFWGHWPPNLGDAEETALRNERYLRVQSRSGGETEQQFHAEALYQARSERTKRR